MSGLGELDGVSGLVEVDAQMGWGALREALSATGWGLQRSALYPARATLGALLEASWPGASAQHAGELRQSVVSLRATHGEPAATYAYTSAPRKASGPDLRYLFIGGEGARGRIVSAGLQLWPRTPGRLIELAADGIEEATAHMRTLQRSGLRVSWSWWAPGRLEVAFHAPLTWMAAQEHALAGVFGATLVLHGGERESARRAELEEAHPWAPGEGSRRCVPHGDAAAVWGEQGGVGAAWDTHNVWIYGASEEVSDVG
jgi:FAD/FMN-containing dehydrogenase